MYQLPPHFCLVTSDVCSHSLDSGPASHGDGHCRLDALLCLVISQVSHVAKFAVATTACFFVTLEVRTLHAGGVSPFEAVVSTRPCTQLPPPHVRFAALDGCTHTLDRGLVSCGYGHYRFVVLHCPGVAWCAHLAMYAVVTVLAASYRM